LTAFHQDFYPSSETLAGEPGFAMESPAKINLGLRILARREDGYHDIETVFQEISLTDRIEFRPSDCWRLTCSDEKLDCGESNLISRASVKLAEACECSRTGAVYLVKRIPIGGGLGGGSSNAAVALLGLARLWNLNINIDIVKEIAAQIGSDCPFFLQGGLACGTGRGDRLEWLSGAIPGVIVLVFAEFSVSTKWAYENVKLSLTKREKSIILKSLVLQPDPLHALRHGTANNFEPAVFARWPELEHLKTMLYDVGADLAALSGSGATVFGIFRSRPRAEKATLHLQGRYRTLICAPVARKRLNSPSCQ
jgi:4-diphosphocytidyl-2-C-methyl-D-erythritol kinase